jgi:hypothetical protein
MTVCLAQSKERGIYLPLRPRKHDGEARRAKNSNRD